MNEDVAATADPDDNKRGKFTSWLSGELAASFAKPDIRYGNAIKGSVVMKNGVLTIMQGSSKLGGLVLYSGSPDEISHFEVGSSRVLGLPKLLAVHRNGAALQIGGASQVLGKNNPVELQDELNLLNSRLHSRAHTEEPRAAAWGPPATGPVG